MTPFMPPRDAFENELFEAREQDREERRELWDRHGAFTEEQQAELLARAEANRKESNE